MVEQLVFYVAAVVVVLAALAMILLRNPVHSALALVLTFVASSVLWILLQAEFLALVLIFVYVGAVMTLFLFIVMMLNLKAQQLRGGFVPYLILALLFMAVMVGLVIFVLSPEYLPSTALVAHSAPYSNIKQLGLVLYTDYWYSLELAAVLLLVAMVAAVGLSHVGRITRKAQNIDKQLQAKAAERLRLVKMAAEQQNRQDKRAI